MFSVSQSYLSQFYQTQNDFNYSLEELSTEETPLLNTLISTHVNKLDRTQEYERLMGIWIEVFIEAKKISIDVRPLFILRFIQYIEFGFSRGWRSPKQLTLIQKIFQNFKFADLKNQELSFYCEFNGVRSFYNSINVEFKYKFPYSRSSFKQNLRIHFDECFHNLEKFSIDILKLTSYECLHKIQMKLEEGPENQILPKISHKDLQPTFEKYLLRPHMSEPLPYNFLKLLSRRINFYVNAMEGSRDGSVPFKLELNTLSPTGFCLYDCIARISRCKTKIDLYITNTVFELDSGNENKVYRSQMFSIFSNIEGPPTISHTRMVRFLPKIVINSNSVNYFLRVDILRQIINQNPSKINMIPRTFFGIEAPFQHFQMYEEWYNSTFSDVFDNMKIPEDFSPGAKMRAVSIRKYFPLLIHTANILMKIHRIGMVHLDIKPKNLLMRLQEDGQLQIMPTDFTRCSSFTIDHDTGDCKYYYWDILRKQKGTKFPYTDWYGLIMTTADVLIPRFREFANEGVLALENMETHKSTSYGYFIKKDNAKYLCGLNLPAEQTMRSLSVMLEDHLKANALLTQCERECFYEIAYKAKAIDLTFDLLIEALEFEKKVIADFPKHESRAMEILIEGSLIDKIHFLNEISMGPALMEELTVRLQKIHQTLERYYKELV